MNELQQELFEQQLLSIARDMEYPATPALSISVMRRIRRSPSTRAKGGRWEGKLLSRRLAWFLMVLLVLCVSLMLIPTARAAILEFIQVGAVRIFRVEPTPGTPPEQQAPVTVAPLTATPAAAPLIPLLESMAGEMTLEAAQQTVEYQLLLPSYPPDLGSPDRVFVQDADGDMTILVWIDPDQPDKVLMSLHFIPAGSWAIEKVEPTVILETTVDDQHAVWTVGPYPLRFRNGDLDFTRMLNGRVLIWTENEITYRLETTLSMEEAIQVAESLEPIP